MEYLWGDGSALKLNESKVTNISFRRRKVEGSHRIGRKESRHRERAMVGGGVRKTEVKTTFCCGRRLVRYETSYSGVTGSDGVTRGKLFFSRKYTLWAGNDGPSSGAFSSTSFSDYIPLCPKPWCSTHDTRCSGWPPREGRPWTVARRRPWSLPCSVTH